MRRITISLMATLMLGLSAVQAWNNHGHGTIAYIAEQHLTPTTREKCHNYLKHTLHYYASWLDHWRFTEPYKHTTRWHASIYDEHNRLQETPALVVPQTEHIWREMRDGGYKRLSDSLVMDNIKYLIHMVGDMHSPVHIVFTHSTDTKHKHNQAYKVYWGKKRQEMSFHTFWDRGSQYLRPGLSYADYQRIIDNYPKRRRAAVVEGTPYTWGTEGAVLMREIYELMPPKSYFNELPAAAVERMREICDRQLVVAGYRLAHVLNTIFDEEYTTTKRR